MEVNFFPNGSHNDQPGKSTTTTTTLPDHIVMEEILPRLPVKSLIRFKCVSKRWLFTISKFPDFAKLHLKFSALLGRHFFAIKPLYENGDRIYKFYLLPYQECIYKSDMVCLGKGDVVDEIRIVVDSCNGIVCLYYHQDSRKENKCYFTLSNPTTHETRHIQSPPGVHLASVYGFGYVPSLDDYKIVAYFATECGPIWTFRNLYVFSLRSGEWERLLADGSEYSLKHGGACRKRKDRSEDEIRKEEVAKQLRDGGIMIGDTLYWPPDEWNPNENIVGFDLVSEKFEEHSCLDWKVKYNEVHLFWLKGCLGLCGYFEGRPGCEFWMLRDANDWNSWQKSFSVNQIRISFKAICETGKCLVQRWEKSKLADLSKEALRHCQIMLCPSLIEKAVDHVDSLVSPFEMIKSADEALGFEDQLKDIKRKT